MSDDQSLLANISLTSDQQKLVDLWEAHTRYEFEDKDIDKTMETMVDGAHSPAHNLTLPTLAGGIGLEEIREFYARYFVHKIPKDTETVLISRTVGDTQIVDEFIFKFTHDMVMDWMLPGVAPTGKKVEAVFVAIIGFTDGKISHEHIYWDQASVLVQLGLIDRGKLPVVGAEAARKIQNLEAYPTNPLLD